MLLAKTPDGIEAATFSFGFNLDEKAVVTQDDDGTVFIEGLASDFDVDRQEEAFEPGCFEQGLKAYLTTNPILLYHHKSDTALGQVVDANITDQGLHVKARVDKPEPGTLIADYVNKIKTGTLRAFSVGGKFFRRMTEKGPRIFKADIGEISVTPYPVNPRTLFAVAGKAFETDPSSNPIEVSDEWMDSLVRIGHLFDEFEGKARNSREGQTPQAGAELAKVTKTGSQHPDSAPVGALLMHLQKVHTLAENTKQNAADPEVQKVADAATKSLAKHTRALHQVAARIGPLPDYYGGLA